ncbi:Protein FAM173B-like protein [Dinothrombium tinctorium]|uniref:Protein FAM173B-like protein n=1 Tax=Dinothrombium tinctorium TaxID=1965070 RepID=A0A3S3P3Z2_9ACAR|nr:Protein FAM173B-like protein [Dinothrombium tinctorium]RWS14330.1 Protein FAM173B-like protein [Dinothrombium tinctorium]RWS14360.1 Protein FAM173B-like protein [Dinothrombium tinctorium]RWS14944.1 Protein FAM173B-like protein [Dinothrombium tinctorium]
MLDTCDRNRSIGQFAAAAFAATGVSLIALSLPFVTPALRRVCLPFVPATDTQLSNVLLALKGRKGRLIDLGSGDGRIVLKAAQLGFEATGVELNFWLVLYSKIKARLLGLNRLASFHRQNLWNVDLSKYENVVIFGVDEMMPILEQKLAKELCSQKDYAVIACRFPLQTATPIKIIGAGIDTVWSLLKFASSVVKYFESNTDHKNEYYVVYSDTCSVDHLSPLHLGENKINAIIRFGNACLSSTPETISEFPVLFVFDFVFDNNDYEFAKEYLMNVQNLSNTLILYETSQVNLVVRLLSECILKSENVAKLNVNVSTWSFTESGKKLVCSPNGKFFEFGQFLVEKELKSFSNLIFIGSFVNGFYRINNCFQEIILLNPSEKITTTIHSRRESCKRVALIEKLKSSKCKRIGVIYTNSYPNVNKLMKYIESLAKKKQKQIFFISLVQSTDECKLGNFGDLHAFVVVSDCYCSHLIDNIKLHVPVVNLTEFEIACGISRNYAGVQWESDSSDVENEDENEKQLVEVATVSKNFWYGLQINPEINEPSMIKEGQRGIACAYEEESANL